jgi:carbon-monoxide dehydrogenase medium subunit
MKSAQFDYHKPKNLNEAIALLGRLEDAKLLAGGQSLVPMMNMRFVQPAHVIDVNGIAGLTQMSADVSSVTIGAMVRQAELLRSKVIARDLPVMAEALRCVGHFQTRSRGTIGGSLCHLDPSAELAVVAALYDAEISVQGPGGERVIAFPQWPLAYMMPSVRPDEIATKISFPLWSDPPGYSFVEFARRHGDFAIVAAACLINLDSSGIITKCSLSIGGADQIVHRLGNVETSIIGHLANEEIFEFAGDLAGNMDTMDDAYVSGAYRKRLVRVLCRRVLKKAVERTKSGGQA